MASAMPDQVKIAVLPGRRCLTLPEAAGGSGSWRCGRRCSASCRACCGSASCRAGAGSDTTKPLPACAPPTLALPEPYLLQLPSSFLPPLAHLC